MTHDEERAPNASAGPELASTVEYWSTQSASLRPRRDHWESHPVVKAAMIERRAANGPGDWLARRLPRLPLRGLSLGAGAGLFELDLVRRGVVTSFDLMDVTPQLMQSASEKAAAEGFGDRVRCLTADINRVELEPASYDLVTFVSALHHVERLEHVLEECRRALRPGGHFFITEYVGPNRFAFPPDHLAIAQAMYRTIDPRLRLSLPNLPSPDPRDVVAADPTEAIRSEEILELVPRYFSGAQVVSLDVCLTLILWYGLNHDALHDTEDGHTLVRWLLDVDRSLVRSGRLPTYHADLLARAPVRRLDFTVRPATSSRPPALRHETQSSAVRFEQHERPRASIVILAWRQREHLLECLRSLRESPADVAFEVIVVLNAASEAVEDALRSNVEGARFIKSGVNLGFAGGCNLGASASRGDFVVFLNDDAIVEPGWLDWLVRCADANPNAGAVGSCILFPDGRIQEVGSVIWNDGSTMPVGRNLDGESLTWHFVRPVDYSSACSLLVRRTTWDAVGGMDPEFHPAYYEDVDLCLSIHALGQQVLFEPRSRVRHHESVSSDSRYKSFLFGRNQKRIVEKWSHELTFHESAVARSSIELTRAVWRARGCPRRVLIIDDRVPDAALGSGYGRMVEAALDLAARGYAVSVYPTIGVARPSDQLVSAGVGIVDEDLANHLQRPEVSYDAVVISRPHNYNHFYATVREHQPRAALVYDCEALFWRRLVRQAGLVATPDEANALQVQADGMRQLEETIAVRADVVVTVSAEEALLLSSVDNHCPIYDILPAERRVPYTARPFVERRDMGFVAGWLAGPTAPNGDGLRWFVSAVLPRVTAVLPWVRLRVTGGGVPAEIRALASPNVIFEGQIADIAAFYDELRVAVAPLRFGAGVKLKTVQALQHGVPVVATVIGAEGVDTRGLPVMDVTDEADEFARCLVAMLTDAAAWEQRRSAIAQLLASWGEGSLDTPWSDVMEKVFTGRPFARDSLLV
jgi:GT2 family glycosyltransferase/SAM-dependent methyltransferase